LTFQLRKLLKVIETNEFPSGITWEGIEERDDFSILFRHRNNPRRLAKKLLQDSPEGRERLKEFTPIKEIKYIGVVPLEIRQKKIELKEKELQIQAGKQKNLTLMWEKIQDIDSRTSSIQADLNKTLKLLERLISILKGSSNGR